MTETRAEPSDDVETPPDTAEPGSSDDPTSRFVARPRRWAVADLRPHHLASVGVVAVLIGVFSTWSTDGGITMNGIQGSHNGWIAIVYSLIAVAVVRGLRRCSWAATAATAVSALAIIWIVVGDRAAPRASTGWGLWQTLLGGLLLFAAPAWAAYSRIRLTDAGRWTSPHASAWKSGVAGVAVVFSVVLLMVSGQVLFVEEGKSWPPPADAITAEGAQAATERFVDGEPRPRDLGLDYAWATAATIEPWPEGNRFFPRIFADIAAAESSVHIIMFGWNSQEVGSELAALLHDKLGEGVEVRILVDSQGSDPQGENRAMYRDLADAGAQIVVNDVIQADADGLFQDRSFDWRQDEVGRADHRKLYVIDGTVAWTGGAGVEDHFRDGGFHDIMTLFEPDIARSVPGKPPSGFAETVESWLWDKLTYFL